MFSECLLDPVKRIHCGIRNNTGGYESGLGDSHAVLSPPSS